MAIQGTTINWSNYKASGVGSDYRQGYDTGNTSSAVYPTIYVSAAAFEAHAQATGSGLWGWQYAALTIYYLNSSGGWTQAWSNSCTARGAGKVNSVFWNHNYYDGSSGDIHDIHTWKVVGDIHGDGKGMIYISAKGIGSCTNSWYDTYCKPSGGRLIRGISGIVSSSSYETPASKRGTPISEASGTYKWICN